MKQQINIGVPDKTLPDFGNAHVAVPAFYGSVIDGKYKILKEIGRGGMSVVYLARDVRLNKRWAVKAVKKYDSLQSKKRGDVRLRLRCSGALSEANLMKSLDHPAIPRIVDIFEDKETIYIVMDYIEGETLANAVERRGPQPEDTVFDWAIQLCSVLLYLHSRTPPVIYGDMKPSNVIITPEGSVKIIDFGISNGLGGKIALGTRGYSPPEQYKGKTDARSDIYSLGMTLCFILTGLAPGHHNAKKLFRKLKAAASEGFEKIITKCVQPKPEDRYRSCMELMKDLKHPERLTKAFRRMRKVKKAGIIAALFLFVVALGGGISVYAARVIGDRRSYEAKLSEDNPESYYDAISIYPGRIKAYEQLIEYSLNHSVSNEEIVRIGNVIQSNNSSLDYDDPTMAELYFSMGKLYFTAYEGSFRERAVSAIGFFKLSAESPAYFDKKEIAKCYYSVCSLLIGQNAMKEVFLSDYEKMFDEINTSLALVDSLKDAEANYDRITFCYAVMLFINSQAASMAVVEFPREIVIETMNEIADKARSVTSSLAYVQELKGEIISNFYSCIKKIETEYNEIEKRGGTE